MQLVVSDVTAVVLASQCCFYVPLLLMLILGNVLLLTISASDGCNAIDPGLCIRVPLFFMTGGLFVLPR